MISLAEWVVGVVFVDLMLSVVHVDTWWALVHITAMCPGDLGTYFGEYIASLHELGDQLVLAWFAVVPRLPASLQPISFNQNAISSLGIGMGRRKTLQILDVVQYASLH